MRKKFKILTALFILITTAVFIVGCGNTKTAKEAKVKVRLNEVTRSVFYAPMYVAMSQGFFGESGIEIDLQTGQAP